MKKWYKLLTIAVVSTLATIAHAQWWFYDTKMYCIVTDTQVRVTLQKENNSLCNAYVATYQRKLKNIAQQVLYVEAYIKKSDADRDYRLGVRDELREDFYTTYNLKTSVQRAMFSFEQQLFIKMKKFLTYYIDPYKSDLESELNLLHKIQNPVQIVTDRILLIEQQLLTIQNMFAATDFETLLPHVQQYLLLRKQIAWQLAS